MKPLRVKAKPAPPVQPRRTFVVELAEEDARLVMVALTEYEENSLATIRRHVTSLTDLTETLKARTVLLRQKLQRALVPSGPKPVEP